eukprot:PhF_6_TR23281/c0_g1_i3/m.32784
MFVKPFRKVSDSGQLLSMFQITFPVQVSDVPAWYQRAQDTAYLKEFAASLVLSWHDPCLYLVATAPLNTFRCMPMFDREPIPTEVIPTFAQTKRLVLIGDAAHPMCPFKGQGFNTGAEDGLRLAKCLTEWCMDGSSSSSSLEDVLTKFQIECVERTRSVQGNSRRLLMEQHTPKVLSSSVEGLDKGVVPSVPAIPLPPVVLIECQCASKCSDSFQAQFGALYPTVLPVVGDQGSSTSIVL